MNAGKHWPWTTSCRPRSTTGSSGRWRTSSTTTRGEVADLIATTVQRCDGADTARRIEVQDGRDLQFIRINGTVVAGLAIHAVGETFV